MTGDKPMTMAAGEHPFARFVRTLGRGKTGSRALDQEEAREAFGMILRNEVEPLQLGAFLMLLRVKEETGAELAGFVQACREVMDAPPGDLKADLDWSSYAGKKHQHPWYLLTLPLLAQADYRVMVHGSDGHTPGRLYTEQAMLELGMPVAGGWQEVGEQLSATGFSYLPLRSFCPQLHELMQLKPLLGLRSPVNTLARMINPLRAPCSFQSIFHPAYARLHLAADQLLGQPRTLVFKGDSGEVEVKPQADTRLHLQENNRVGTVMLERSNPQRVSPVAEPATSPLRALWRDRLADDYGLAAVIATTSAALLLLAAEHSPADARRRAIALWQARRKDQFD